VYTNPFGHARGYTDKNTCVFDEGHLHGKGPFWEGVRRYTGEAGAYTGPKKALFRQTWSIANLAGISILTGCSPGADNYR